MYGLKGYRDPALWHATIYLQETRFTAVIQICKALILYYSTTVVVVLVTWTLQFGRITILHMCKFIVQSILPEPIYTLWAHVVTTILYLLKIRTSQAFKNCLCKSKTSIYASCIYFIMVATIFYDHKNTMQCIVTRPSIAYC